MRAIGGDDIVSALEAQLRANVPAVVTALGFEYLGEVQEWQVVPDLDALTTARFPAVAIVSPRVGASPQRGNKTYSATWQASVGVFDRDTDHKATQTRVQQWAKVLRVAALINPLTGTGIALRWAGEEYDVVPTKQNARTIAGAEVLFDAIVDTALDLTESNDLPPLQSVHNNITPTN